MKTSRVLSSSRILFSVTALSVGGLMMAPLGFAGDPVPADAAKAVEKAADKTVAAAQETKDASDQLTRSTALVAEAPAAEAIRNVLATTTEAAITNGGFKSVVKHFVDADRNRLDNFKSNDDFKKLDGRIDSFRKNWKSKYGQDFSFNKISNDVLGDSFARISQGEIGKALNAEGKVVPSDEPKMAAGAADSLKQSGVAKTDANSGKIAGGDSNKDIGREIATVLIPAAADFPELAIPFIHELPNSWKIDLPDNTTGQMLYDNLLTHVTMVDEDRVNWPADVNEAYRVVTRHVMTAVMTKENPRVGLSN